MEQAKRIAGHHIGWLLAAAAILVMGATVPEMMREAVGFAAWSLLEMAPVIGLAVLASAVVRASGADGLLSRAFAQRSGFAVVLSAGIGAVTPICGVGVLPIVASLLGAGVPLAPVMAFWLASPVTDPGMLAITAGTLGMPFAVAKTTAAVVIGIAGGAATAVLVRTGAFQSPLKGRAQSPCTTLEERGLKAAFWRDPSRRALFRADALDAAQLIGKWLTVAFLLEGLLRQVLPAELVAEVVGGGNAWAIPLAVVLGAPIYLDGYAALPLVRGLMDMGMAPGAAMAFLIAGGVTSLYASVAVYALVRSSVFAWYLFLAVVFSLAAGYSWQALGPLVA
jgi:uncharacterized membrane protein YraQ (UPF0718 family)